MTGLGLRYCPNHQGEPLMLVARKGGVFWRCEHPSECAYTEDAAPRTPRGTGSGRERDRRARTRTGAPQSVEDIAIRNAEGDS